MNQTPSSIFKQISIIHIALCIGTTLVVGIIYTSKAQNGEVISSTEGMNILELVVPVMALLSFAVAYYLGKHRYKKLDINLSLSDKLNVYRANNVILWAALEGSAFFAAIAFYLTGRNNLLLYAVMLAVLLIYFRPLKTRATEDLKLSQDESDELDTTT